MVCSVAGRFRLIHVPSPILWALSSGWRPPVGRLPQGTHSLMPKKTPAPVGPHTATGGSQGGALAEPAAAVDSSTGWDFKRLYLRYDTVSS